MLYGEFQHTIDPKGRVIVPFRFREDLGEKFILTKGLDGCICAYSMNEWSKFDAKLSQLPDSDKEARAYARFFYSGAIECEFDKQGRILIPQNLRTHAGLDKDIYIIGVSARAEIWDKARRDAINADEAYDPELLAPKMTKYNV
ncbi:MAG: division/cell wall cluster transcriptional repressor MraZ [Clostridiales bacterium]|nr:division/cell wall cluster transcriptional repressor MraZ [Clostridiales bacterium]